MGTAVEMVPLCPQRTTRRSSLGEVGLVVYVSVGPIGGRRGVVVRGGCGGLSGGFSLGRVSRNPGLGSQAEVEGLFSRRTLVMWARNTSSGECDTDAPGGAGAACAYAAGGAVAAVPAASGGSVAPAGGGSFNSVATLSGGGGIACGGGGSGECGKVVDSGAVGDGCDWRDVRCDGAKGSVVVKHDGDGGGANPDEAAHFVGWANEGAAEVVGVVKNGDPLLVVRREEKAKGLDKLRNFVAEARFEFHRAGETGDVAVASLVHRGDRGEERFPGGVEMHGFLSYKS